MGYVILIGLVIIAVIFFLRITGNVSQNKERDRICAEINCGDGTFFALGNKNRLIIIKDKRYIFEIIDGRIVSVKERQGLFYKKVVY